MIQLKNKKGVGHLSRGRSTGEYKLPLNTATIDYVTVSMEMDCL
jgi:hypothetical protein